MTIDLKRFDVVEVTDQQDLDAGDFSTWLRATQDGLTDQHEADVPCGHCNACCRSSYFIHIGANEDDALTHIPKALLFPAPGQPKGNVIMGFDATGCCPMLVDGQCSIYEHRPKTCRNYDCRIFPAAGIQTCGDEKQNITKQAGRWRFSYGNSRDRTRHAATKAAATFLTEHCSQLANRVPSNPSQLAIQAIKIHDLFLEIHDQQNDGATRGSDEQIVQAIKDRLLSLSA